MATYYLDYEGGNDSNNGTTFANRWKTLTNGATAVRIAAGDTIRVMASPDPTSLGINGTWTDEPLSATVVPVSSTNATPIVITMSAGHGLVTGDTIIVNGHTTNTKANGVWQVSVSSNAVTLLNADGTNSVGNGVGGATGTVRKATNCRVLLASAITANIAVCGNQGAKTNWTASSNITDTVINTDYKEGGECQQIAVQTAFTTGLAAYFATGTLNLSGYQQVSFWIKQTAGTLVAASDISLKLCSDTAGVTSVNTISIPAIGALNQWSPITIDTAGALGSAIQSIALYINTDSGAQTFLLDNIIACKASSSADSLSLTSLIGKNTGTEDWFGIQSINSTRVMLDRDVNCTPNATPQRGYSGTTETVTTCKRETIKTAMAATNVTQIQAVKNSGGTSGNYITFSGGWNRTDMSTQTGQTYFDGQNGFGYGIYCNNNYINLDHINCYRYYVGLYPYYAYKINISSDCSNNSLYGIDINYSQIVSVTSNNCNNSGTGGIYIIGGLKVKINVVNTNSNASCGVSVYTSFNNNINVTNCKNNVSGIIFNFSTNNTMTIVDSGNNSTASITYANTSTDNYLRNSALNSTVKVSGQNVANGLVWSMNENNNTDTHFGYAYGGLISSNTTTVHTAGGMSWQMAVTNNTIRDTVYPLELKIATVACAANVARTVSAWFRRDNTGLTARLNCRGGQLSGIANDVTTAMTVGANTWEQVSVTVTPTQKGVLEFYAECYGGTTYNCYIDDVTFI